MVQDSARKTKTTNKADRKAARTRRQRQARQAGYAERPRKRSSHDIEGLIAKSCFVRKLVGYGDAIKEDASAKMTVKAHKAMRLFCEVTLRTVIDEAVRSLCSSSSRAQITPAVMHATLSKYACNTDTDSLRVPEETVKKLVEGGQLPPVSFPLPEA